MTSEASQFRASVRKTKLTKEDIKGMIVLPPMLEMLTTIANGLVPLSLVQHASVSESERAKLKALYDQMQAMLADWETTEMKGMDAMTTKVIEILGSAERYELLLGDLPEVKTLYAAIKRVGDENASLQRHIARECYICKTACSKLCKTCKKVAYCSEVCQAKDWARHKKEHRSVKVS